ncbi:MAG: rRNA maturation RNase YbeY [Pseudomonadota bacterium]
MSIEIFIPKHDKNWPDVDHLVREAVLKTLEHVSFEEQTEISCVLADNDFVQELNKNYRGKDKPTNVLSFPQDDKTFMNLGDVIFARETIEKEAVTQNKKFNDHLAHLTVHGTLHLLGYDHEDDDQAEEMEGLEIEILNALNVENPYIDRS